MKFLMLLRKELRESLPWLLLAGIGLFAVGAFILGAEGRFDRSDWAYSQLKAGEAVSPYWLANNSVLTGPAVWLYCVSTGLGLVLAAVHFWAPRFSRTWPFLLHRSVERATILSAKLAAALVGFVVSLGTAWIILYGYASRPGVFPAPVPVRTFAIGWLYMLLGLVVYLGASLAGLSRARWYTTKIFGLIFAGLVFIAIPVDCGFLWAFLIMAVSIVILLAQIFETFLKREY